MRGVEVGEAPDFRAILGAVSLKLENRVGGDDWDTLFPRHPWRGLIEAFGDADGLGGPMVFPRHPWRGLIEAAATGAGRLRTLYFRAILGAVSLKHHQEERLASRPEISAPSLARSH